MQEADTLTARQTALFSEASTASATHAHASAPASSSRKVRAKLWAAAGFACFGLGAVGVALPILPTTPFMLLAAFCFARSSQRVNDWFRSTKLYRSVLEGYVTKRAMTASAKLKIITPVTVLLGVSFALMSNVPVGRAVVAAVWLAHLVYFGFVVKTERA
ncbi:MAG: YbaN family protein [Eggerthellaceae bacterium]|nr:YbaN family protein [Eggerthellaceae bacterium]